MLVGVLIAALGIAPGTLSAENSDANQGVKGAVIAAYDAAIVAAEAMDREAVGQTIAQRDDATVILGGELITGRQKIVDRVRLNFERVKSVKYQLASRDVTVLSPESALLVTHGSVTVEPIEGAPFTTPFAHTMVYIREGTAWRVLHSHQSSPR